MRDHITYETLAGHRPVRRYVAAAGLIACLLGLLFGWIGWQWVQAGPAAAAPEILSDSVWQGEPPLVENLPAAAAGCPADPEAWSLLDTVPGDNYKRIEPGCVYVGLSSTVAWHMLARQGYTKQEAAERLGFDEPPWQPTQVITGMTSTKGPLLIPLEMEWAAHEAFRTWMVDADGQPGLVYSLRGCYRTRTVTGNDVQIWERYPVICTVAMDREPGWVVGELDEWRFSADLTGTELERRFALFGYTGELWVLLGEPRDWVMAIANPSAAGDEREQVTTRLGTVPWDAAWLASRAGREMHPLPDAWRMYGVDPAVIQGIADALDQTLQTRGGLP